MATRETMILVAAVKGAASELSGVRDANMQKKGGLLRKIAAKNLRSVRESLPELCRKTIASRAYVIGQNS